MGIYSSCIFPRVMDMVLSGEEIGRIRQSVLANVQGEVFEIGFGTGLNLPHYPPTVRRITAVEPNAGAGRLSKRRIAASPIEVVLQTMSGDSVPQQNGSFDSVVCTFTLCSILQVDQALAEMWRILKPGGHFHFVEHGLSADLHIQWWQHKLTPIQRIIGDGCHLDRDPGELLCRHGFRIERMENFYLQK